MSYKTIIGTLFIFICIPLGYAWLQRNVQRDSGLFIVGTAAGYAPFVSINEQGVYEGFDIDVATALAQKMDKKLVLKDLGSMTALFMALEQGSIDAIIWGLSITQDRLNKVAMIRYQGQPTIAYPLIFWKEIPKDIQSINDMRNKIVCVEPTSSQDTVLSKYPCVIKLATERVDDALLHIQYGKADAAFVEPAIAKKFKAYYPEIQILNVPLPPEDQVQGVGIALKKDAAQLIACVQQAIVDLTNGGIVQAYETKWDII